MGTSDKCYIERCLDGHPDDFRYLVRRYQAVLLAHLAGQLGNRDWAEEAAQEALVRALFWPGKTEEARFVLLLAARYRQPRGKRTTEK